MPIEKQPPIPDREIQVEFKSAPLGSVQVWRLSGTTLTNSKGKQTALSKVRRSIFADVRARGLWVSTFTLLTESNQVCIGCNDWKAGSHRRNYFKLMFALLEILETHNPHLAIQHGSHLANILLGCLCIAGFGVGLAFIAGAVAIFKDGGLGPSIAFAIMGLVMAVPCGLSVWSSPPWQKPPTRTPSEFKAWLRDWVSR